MIRFQCPSCQRQINAKDTAAGTASKCPGCGAPVKVPPGISDDDVLAALGDYEPQPTIDTVTAEIVEEPPESLAVVEAVQSVEEPTPPFTIFGVTALPASLIGGGFVLFMCCGVVSTFLPEDEPAPQPTVSTAAPAVPEPELTQPQATPIQPQTVRYVPDIEAAWKATQTQLVPPALPRPNTARYGSQRAQDQVEYLSNREYDVSGWVACESAGGEPARIDFILIVRDDGGGKWKITDEVMWKIRFAE
ncbi:MAG: hypothetical protein CMJ64_15550 [Planctomycetaceae bacterium]|nr:hypothetical protein [Planctomycetaceae bacterium]